MPIIGVIVGIWFVLGFGPAVIAGALYLSWYIILMAALLLTYIHMPGIFLYIICSITYSYTRITSMRLIATFCGTCVLIYIPIAFLFSENWCFTPNELKWAIENNIFGDALPGLEPGWTLKFLSFTDKLDPFYVLKINVIAALHIFFVVFVLGQIIFLVKKKPLNEYSLRIGILLNMFKRVFGVFTKVILGIVGGIVGFIHLFFTHKDGDKADPKDKNMSHPHNIPNPHNIPKGTKIIKLYNPETKKWEATIVPKSYKGTMVPKSNK